MELLCSCQVYSMRRFCLWHWGMLSLWRSLMDTRTQDHRSVFPFSIQFCFEGVCSLFISQSYVFLTFFCVLINPLHLSSVSYWLCEFQEDNILREQIGIHGTENWAIIVSKFKDKTR